MAEGRTDANDLTVRIVSGAKRAATEEFARAESVSPPERLGRFRILSRLGVGGFGVVYKGYDEALQRAVAIKIPHQNSFASPEILDAYLAEARTLAGLDHPNIVSIHDVGRTDNGCCYLVSKFVEGTNLEARVSQGRFTRAEAVNLIACVAEALHHAHQRGLVHRDVKPGNILLDANGQPVLVDFGLALREQDYGTGPVTAGTPSYMSPEQARGEGHLVDARTDVYSLGVIFYELLTGLRPFRDESHQALLEQIKFREPRPPRQLDDRIPKELDRICLKAISKRALDRYSTALDLAEDLRAWQAEQVKKLNASNPSLSVVSALDSAPQSTVMSAIGNLIHVVVPKGLRAFDAEDADFFLDLLPGPRDRNGLPDSIRFWKTRVEEADPDRTFRVGLLYGPSGCGKSSLVKAGLMPRLSPRIVPVYVEATADDTEKRLLAGVRKACPAAGESLGLVELLTQVRRGPGLAADRKLLIVIDQFEQWLHANHEEQAAELVQALRQCDGQRVQCIVLVRDDFWLAVSRFMRELEVRLVEGQNTVLVDLFDLLHAHKVSAAFGKAFGRLAATRVGWTADEKRFLERAVDGMAQDGKVVPVRLSLFAEMVKGKPWTMATLKRVGGAEGIGVTFLEDTFSAATAPPEHRLHQDAARAVLNALLPEQGSDLKGHMRSHADLLEASGYGRRPRDFEDLLRILDNELRLVTPTEAEGKDDKQAKQARSASAGSGRYYHLTHDYLVSSLRQWLTRKQRETRRGRAELSLAERSGQWNAKPENRRLPTWWECLNIGLLTRRRDWTPPQQKMMRRAGLYHAVNAAAFPLLFAIVVWAGWYVHGLLRAEALVDNLMAVDTSSAPALAEEIKPYRPWAERLLRRRLEETPPDSKAHLHAALALSKFDTGQADYLGACLLTSNADEMLAIRAALGPLADSQREHFWAVLRDGQKDPHQRLRAACLLALDDADAPDWDTVAPDLVRQLSLENHLALGKWATALYPLRARLVPLVVERLVNADPYRYASLLFLLAAYPDEAIAELDRRLDVPAAGPADKERQFTQQAQAAVALLQLGRGERVWRLLRATPDPTLRYLVVQRLGPLHADPQMVVERLTDEVEVSVRRALLLSLGEFHEDEWTGMRKTVVERLLKQYQDDPDPGVHSAIDWVLRRWHCGERLDRLNAALAAKSAAPGRRWYVNARGQTLAVVPGPSAFTMGSPADESGRGADETQHRRLIPRNFAIATKPVTVAQYLAFDRKHNYFPFVSPSDTAPINRVTWYDAAKYCRWLSEQEGVPEEQMCFPPLDQIKPGMTLPANYLQRTGYRLPTEAEWECASRAGATTPWWHGISLQLFDATTWYERNSDEKMHAAGLLLPNDFGLFDMLGNAWEWCQTPYGAYHKAAPDDAITDKEDPEDAIRLKSRVLRGGGYGSPTNNVRCASRLANDPGKIEEAFSFRVARTCP